MSKLFVRTLREDPADAEVPEPPAAGARGLHPPRRARHLLLAAAGPARLQEGRADRPRGDGRHRRPGAAVPGAAAARALRGDRAVDRLRRRHLPAQGPQGQRLPARPDARGDVHPGREGPVLVVQGPAGVALPDPDQVPRRGASPRGPDPGARVRDEGLLLLRHHRRGARRVVRRPPRGLHPDLRPARLRLRDRQGDQWRDGWLEVRGVPGEQPGRRGHLRALHEVRLRRQRRGRPGAPARRRAGRV